MWCGGKTSQARIAHSSIDNRPIISLFYHCTWLTSWNRFCRFEDNIYVYLIFGSRIRWQTFYKDGTGNKLYQYEKKRLELNYYFGYPQDRFTSNRNRCDVQLLPMKSYSGRMYIYAAKATDGASKNFPLSLVLWVETWSRIASSSNRIISSCAECVIRCF